MTKITSAEIQPCTQQMQDANWKFGRGALPAVSGCVLILRDEDNRTGIGYAHAVPVISTTQEGAHAALNFLTPLLIGKQATDIGAIMAEVDGALAQATSAKAAIDMALHDLLAKQLHIPVHVLLGGKKRSSIPVSRIVAIKSPNEMARHAAALVSQGYHQLKLKLSGHASDDIARVAAVRSAVGPEITLTLDPNQTYTAKGMIATFAKLERHDISLIEQPVPADDLAGLKLCTDTLPVLIEADESAQSIADVLHIVSERIADHINLRTNKLGGIRKVMAAVQLCEAGCICYRIGASMGPSLMQAASVQLAATFADHPIACELAEHLHLVDDPFTPLVLQGGAVLVPEMPGCGVAFLKL